MDHRMLPFGVVLLLGLITLSVGCQNRRPLLSNNTFGPLRGATRVSPPNTYALQIPGQPNSNQGSGVRSANNVQPNQVNVQGGWQPAGSATGNTPDAIPPANSGTSTNSTIANQTQVVAVTAPSREPIGAVQNRVAQNNTGLSYTDRTNFRTTAVDERLDRSRLPVTDASQVRAPTRFTPSTTVGQFNAPYYVPNNNVNSVAPQYQNTVPRYATNPQTGQVINPNLAQNGYNGNTIVGSFGQPTFAQPPQQMYAGFNAQNQVLAQSTVYADPANNPNSKNGWTSRELTASRDSLNR